MGRDATAQTSARPGKAPEALLSLAATAARHVLASRVTPETARQAMAAIPDILPDAVTSVLVRLPGQRPSPSLWLTAPGPKHASMGGSDGNLLADLLTVAFAREQTVLAGVTGEARLPSAWQKAGITWAAAIPFAVTGSARGGMVVRGPGAPPDAATIAFLETIGYITALGLVSDRSKARYTTEESLPRLLDSVIRVREEERARISRELHDEANQSLTSLFLDLALLARVVEDPAAREHIARVREQAAEVFDGLRRLVRGLRPPDLEQLGLGLALESLCQTFSERHGIAARFYHVDQDCPCRSAAIDMALYRITQEALANVARHADATQVGVVLACRDGLITVQVEDDGNGRAKEVAGCEPGEQLGILGMRERAALLGGKVSIESSPGHGTTVYVKIPAGPASQGDL